MGDAREGGRRRTELCAWLLCGLLLAALSEWGLVRAARELEPQASFTGVIAEGPHLAMAGIYGGFTRECAEGGGPLVHNLQTSEPHAPALARPWEFALGRFAGALGLGPAASFRLERWIACVLFVGALAGLGAALGFERRWRVLLVAAAVSGGSLYWCVDRAPPIDELSRWLSRWLDAYHASLSGLGFSYPALWLGVPHLALEVAFFAATLACALRAAGASRCASERASAEAGAAAAAAGGALAAPRASALWHALAGLCCFLLTSVRPYSAPIALLSCAAIGLVDLRRSAGARWSCAARWLLVALPSLPLLAHDAWALRAGSPFGGLDVDHPAPPPLEIALFVGLPALGLLAWLAPRTWTRARATRFGSSQRAALWTWAAAHLALLNARAIVRWEVEALLPLTLLCLIGALQAARALALPRWLLALLLASNAIGGLAWLREGFERARSADSGFALLAGERAAFDWLQAERAPRALCEDRPAIALACAPSTGVFAPWLAGVRAWLGHPDHTRDFGLKQRALRAFYRFGSGAAELAGAGVTHVLWGPREQSWAGGEDVGALLARHPRLRLLLEREGVRLYRLE